MDTRTPWLCRRNGRRFKWTLEKAKRLARRYFGNTKLIFFFFFFAGDKERSSDKAENCTNPLLVPPQQAQKCLSSCLNQTLHCALGVTTCPLLMNLLTGWNVVSKSSSFHLSPHYVSPGISFKLPSVLTCTCGQKNSKSSEYSSAGRACLCSILYTNCHSWVVTTRS